MGSTEFTRCLRVVLQSSLQRDGQLVMPVGHSSVETVTDLQRAVELTRQYLIPADTNHDHDHSHNPTD